MWNSQRSSTKWVCHSARFRSAHEPRRVPEGAMLATVGERLLQILIRLIMTPTTMECTKLAAKVFRASLLWTSAYVKCILLVLPLVL